MNKPDATLQLALVGGEIRLISFDTSVDFEFDLLDLDNLRDSYASRDVCYCLDVDDGGHVHRDFSNIGTFTGGRS